MNILANFVHEVTKRERAEASAYVHQLYEIALHARERGESKHIARRSATMAAAGFHKDSDIYRDRHEHIERALGNVYGQPR